MSRDEGVSIWLRGHQSTLVRAAVLTHLDGVEACDARVRALHHEALAEPGLRAVIEAQHGDGSWGAASNVTARILSTLLVTRSLVDVGLTCRIDAVQRALDFLCANALTPAPTVDGHHDGALPCYAGMLADVLMRGGRSDAATPALAWIAQYQQIRVHGDELVPGAGQWGDYLATRYGGCFASTSCYVGVAASARALVEARRLGLRMPGRADEVIEGARELVKSRQVCFTSAGQILPLAAPTKGDPSGTRWVAPVHPRNYLPDVIDLIAIARRLGVDSAAMAPAVEVACQWQFSDGRWAMAARRSIDGAYFPERVSRSRASAWITLRACEALVSR